MLLTAFVVLAVVVGIREITIAKPSVKYAPNPNIQPSYLLIQESESATLMPVQNKKGVYTLTLKNVSPNLTYFSDRPHRIAGKMTIDDYLALWKDGKDSFQNDNPNVGLISATFEAQTDHGVRSDVLELFNPVYDPAKKTLTYYAKPLHEGFYLQSGTYQTVSLFIDEVLFCVGCLTP